MHRSLRKLVMLLAAFALFAAACGSEEAADTTEEADTDATAEGEREGRPTVVVTTSILGDVVANLVGDEMDVVTVMPVGADPHSFQPSAQEVDMMTSADVLVANGGGFEEGLLDIVESAESDGVPTLQALDLLDALAFGENAHDHGDEDHGDEDHGDEDGGDEDRGDEDDHDHEVGADDPHFFTDPARMATAARGIADFLIDDVDGVDAAAIESNSAAYIAELEAADADIEELLSSIPVERRVLVTNHEVFGYFADRYGFEVVGAIIPGGSTTDGVSAGELADLVEVIEDEGVPAIFGDTSSSEELVDTLADEVGSIRVVDLYSESLGEDGSEGATYLDMIRTNAQRIADALNS